MAHHRFGPVLGATLVLSAAAHAQASWTFLTPAIEPSARTNAHGDADLTGLLMFGGNLGQNTFVDELWKFDGSVWVNLTPASGSPSARISHAAAFDVARQRLVIFGGWDTNATLADTWEWDGTTWTQITPPSSPPARRWAEMVFDFQSLSIIMFGGYDGANALNDTWRWDGVAWTQLSPANSPSPRGRHGMAYDAARGRVVVFGGQPGGSSAARLGDTWEWDGVDWTQVTTTNTPGGAGLLQPGMTYDSLRQRVVISGGYNGAYLSNTWEYDGSDWTDRGAVPGFERAGGLIGYVGSIDKTLAFGGFRSAGGMQQLSAEYQTNAIASYAATATGGCSGAAGSPMLGNTGAPWLGDTFTVQVTGLSPTAIPFVVLGFALQTTPLAPFGGPGCQGLITPDDAFLVANSGGSASWSPAVPNSPALIGLTFHNQCIALAPSGSLVSSDRGDGVVGVR